MTPTRAESRIVHGSLLARAHILTRSVMRSGSYLAAVVSLVMGSLRAAEPSAGAAILRELETFSQLGSVLYVAAHPDDESNSLLAQFARGRGYRTAYLSLTRGDGGQNELGPE